MSHTSKNILAVLFIFLVLPIATNASDVRIVQGGYDELKYVINAEVRNGKYHAIECKALQCKLVPRTLINRRSKVWSYGNASHPEDGFKVKVINGSKALALVSGLSNAKPGRIKTWFYRDTNAIYKASNVLIDKEHIAINENGSKLSIFLSRKAEILKPTIKTDCTSGINAWMLEAKGHTSVIMEDCVEYEDDALGNQMDTSIHAIKWIGDIDNDGFPDFIVSPHARSIFIYLSSDIKTGQDWQPAATSGYTDPMDSGC